SDDFRVARKLPPRNKAGMSKKVLPHLSLHRVVHVHEAVRQPLEIEYSTVHIVPTLLMSFFVSLDECFCQQPPIEPIRPRQLPGYSLIPWLFVRAFVRHVDKLVPEVA